MPSPIDLYLNRANLCLGGAGIPATQTLAHLWSKVAQGGKHKGERDIKIRQIWRDTENSYPAFDLAQQDAVSTYDDERSIFQVDLYFQLHIMGDRAKSQFFLLRATMVHHSQTRH